MPSFNKKFIGGTRYHASGSTTYVTPTGQEVVSTPSSTSSVPVNTVYSKTGTPTYYTGGPCGNKPCGTPRSSSPSSSSVLVNNTGCGHCSMSAISITGA